MTIDLEHYKKKLQAEKKVLETELEKVGRKNPDNPSDWEAVSTDKDSGDADENVAADSIEQYEGNVAIVNTLETRYGDLKSALDKMKHGTFGLCQVCKEEIDPERLEANPSARTCRKHMV